MDYIGAVTAQCAPSPPQRLRTSLRIIAQVKELEVVTGDADRDEALREQQIDVLEQQLQALQAEQQRVLDELVKETSDLLKELWKCALTRRRRSPGAILRRRADAGPLYPLWSMGTATPSPPGMR